MINNRSILLVASALVVVFLVGGGLAFKAGAADDSYRQAILFAEILSLVTENYVDPVEVEKLLDGAYEGLLAGLDIHGAYLTPEEVAEWKADLPADHVDVGLTVLKAGRTLLIVGVDPGSAAADAGIKVGDQIRAIDGVEVVTRSQDQARRMLSGRPGSQVTLNVLTADVDFRPEDIELVRAPRRGRPLEIERRQGVAVLRVRDLERASADELRSELETLSKAGVAEVLLDLRNVADGSTRRAAELAAAFTDKPRLRLRDRAGRILETVSVEASPVWSGTLSVLVNGATASGGEALAKLVRLGTEARIYGEKTFGLGAEPQLMELEDGSGLLVSAGLWETPDGEGWNESGIEPDEEVNGEGEDFAALAADQLDKVLDLLVAQREQKAESKAA